IAYPATGLHDLGCLQVAEIHQHPGREAVEVTGTIRLMGKQRGNAQLGVADFERIADVEAEYIEQAWFDPQGAWLGNARGKLVGAEGLLADAHFAAQGVAGRDRLDAAQLYLGST